MAKGKRGKHRGALGWTSAGTGGAPDLKPLFQPEHIAVIGASRTPGKQGHTVVQNLVRCGFQGRILPVNPAGGDIEGLQCFASITDVPRPIDCAIVVVPAAVAVNAVRQCAEAGVKAVVVGASGFAELGTPEGRERQAALTAIARASGLRLVGPNTNGIYNATDRVSLGYNAMHGEPITGGTISVASHSGALFGGVLKNLTRFGFGLSKFVPVGNEADLDMLDFLEYFIEDRATRVIGLIIEAIADGARFQRLAERSRDRGKPIVALKVGRLAVGVGAALAHSSRLAGSARAYDAFFHACGIAGVRSVEALAGGCAVLAARAQETVHSDRRLVCVASSGAGGAVTVDFAAERGIPLAGDGTGEWAGPIASAIAAIPTPARIRNPIDLGSIGGDWSRLSELFAVLAKCGVTGPAVVYAHIAPNPAMDETLLNVLAKRKAQTGAPLVVVAPGGLAESIEAGYRAHGIPVFHDTATCLESLSCHYATLPPTTQGLAPTPKRRYSQGRTVLREVLRKAATAAAPSLSLSELASAGILRRLGVQMVESRRVRSLDQARRAAARVGYPVVLKALAPAVGHKSKLGLVIIDITNSGSLAREYRGLERRVAAQGYRRRAVTFVLQPMIRAKAELIIGVSREEGLGHFLVAGFGGIHAEILDEVSLFPISTDAQSLRTSIVSTRLGSLLADLSRDLGGADLVGQLVGGLDALQRLVVVFGDAIESVDVNPCLVGPEGLIAVDALIVLKSSPKLRPKAAPRA